MKLLSITGKEENIDKFIADYLLDSGIQTENAVKVFEKGWKLTNFEYDMTAKELLKDCKELLEKYKIKKYFFLDSSFPMIHLLSSHEEKNIALRISEFEGMDTARNMAGRVNWIWIDCFTKIPVKKHEYDELKYLGYGLCFVSPELEGRDQDIEIYKRHLENEGMIFDAICTKGYNIGRWE